MRQRSGSSGLDEPDPHLTTVGIRRGSIWAFVGSEVVPVVYLTVSVIDGTDAVWAQIVGVLLVLSVAVCLALAYWWWFRFARLRWIPVAAMVVCSVAALVVMIAGNSGSNVPVAVGPAPVGAPTTAITSPAAVTPTGASPLTPSGPVSTANCWTAAGTSVDCREYHRLERIGAQSPCDLAAVTRFLGGTVAVDVVTAKAASAPGGGCALRSAVDVSGSAQNVLQTDGGGAWRRCYDRRTGSVVSCSQVHSSEFVATGDLRRATVGECQSAAEIYLDQELATVMNDLTTAALSVASGAEDPARCSIDARGNHLLTGTVRSLGSSPVPVQAP